MFSTRTLILASLLAASTVAAAGPSSHIEAVTLETVIVTPTARYSPGEWQARQTAVLLAPVVVTPRAQYSLAEWQARRSATHTLAAVTLEPVIVTPKARYTLAEWQQRKAGIVLVKQEQDRSRMKRWLKMVWKHFQFARTPVEV